MNRDLPMLLVVAFAGLWQLGVAQNSAPPENAPATVSAYVPPVELIRAASANELAQADDNSHKHAFRSIKRNASGSQTRLYVETNEAMAGMTIAYNDKPLTPEQLQGEEDHLHYLERDAGARRAKHDRELEELDRTRRILKALPDAFLYDYDGSAAGTDKMARLGIKLTRLRFRPNPNYSPPSRIEQVLTGMKGFVLVDPVSHHLALLDATLERDVSFGWGLFGHLDKGGSLLLSQVALDDGMWVLDELRMKFTGKILLFKNLNVNSDEELDQFTPVPADLTFAQAVERIEAERNKLAASSAAGAPVQH